MAKWLYKILFIVISISFFICATEMDLGICHNTFFDEYDTYAKTEQVSVDHEYASQQQADKLLLFHSFFDNYKAVKIRKLFSNRLPAGYFDYYLPKLFLHNSV